MQLQNNGINRDSYKLFAPYSMHINFSGELIKNVFLMSLGEDINSPLRNDRQAF
jgi:hypothetical protein